MNVRALIAYCLIGVFAATLVAIIWWVRHNSVERRARRQRASDRMKRERDRR